MSGSPMTMLPSGGAMTVEADYSRHREVIAELMAFYRDMAVKPMLIKGYGLSLDYPTPEHRASGDIDVYLYHLGEYADQMVSSRLGIEVKQNEDKHSVFEFKGATVEGVERDSGPASWCGAGVCAR